MKINIIHHNNSSDVIIDAQTLDYIFKRCKEKTDVKHVLVNNSEIDESTINIFIDTFNNILFEKAKMNVYVPNQHKFHKNWLYVLNKFDLIICKTKYCYETLKPHVEDTTKLRYIGWKSYDFYQNYIEKENDQWMLLYNDNDYLNVQNVVDIWKPEYPVLNIVYSGVNSKRVKRKNLVNINYIDKMDHGKFENFFNKCLVHLCLNEIDNFNYNVNQCLMVKSVPIILDKGPVLEVVDDECCFKVSSTKKKLKNSLGSHYKYTKEDLETVIEKVIKTSDTTLEIMGNNGFLLSQRNNGCFANKCVDLFKECFSKTLHIKFDRKEVLKSDLPSVSLITTVTNAHNMFKLPRLNFMSTNYPKDKLEWIIVDDSDEGKQVDDLLPPESKRELFNIKYVRLENKLNEGKKLNMALEKYCNNDVIVIMNYDDFFYENSISSLVTKLVKSKGKCVGMTSFGCFDINRYISIINVEHMVNFYYNRIYTGGLTFYKEYWDKGNKFNEEPLEKVVQRINNEEVEHSKLEVLVTFFDDKYSDFTEISWNNILVGLIHNGNNNERLIDEKQEPNGCHFKFSRKVFEFVCSLDGKKITTEPISESHIESNSEQVNNPEVKEI